MNPGCCRCCVCSGQLQLVKQILQSSSAKDTRAKLSASTVLRWQAYSASRFISDADTEIKRIHESGKIPLLAGGTMLYYRALWDGLSNLPASDPVVREQLENTAKTHGQQALYERLE